MCDCPSRRRPAAAAARTVVGLVGIGVANNYSLDSFCLQRPPYAHSRLSGDARRILPCTRHSVHLLGLEYMSLLQRVCCNSQAVRITVFVSVTKGLDKIQPKKNILMYFLTVQLISTTYCTSRKQVIPATTQTP